MSSSKKSAKKKDDAAPSTPIASPKPEKAIKLIVRPANSGITKCARAYINLHTLKRCNIEAGAILKISGQIRAIAVPGECDPDVILLSVELRRLAKLSLGDCLVLEKASRPPDAKILVIEGDSIDETQVDKLLRQVELIHTHINIDGLTVVAQESNTPDLEKLSISEPSGLKTSPQTTHMPYIVSNTTQFKFIKTDKKQARSYYSHIGGLSRELNVLRTKIELPLNRPELFERFSSSPDRGFLLYGPPGTGKTLLLKAVAAANEDLHIVRVNGPSLYSRYQGDAEKALKDIFDEAKRFEPSLIFIDELDALAPRRESDDSGETESRIVATLLLMMDGMEAGQRVVVLGATNRPNSIDPALRRPGRFGVEIEIGIPDVAGRKDILETMLRQDIPHHLKQSDIDEISAQTHGYVGADLRALVRESVFRAIDSGLEHKLEPTQMFLERVHFDEALLNVQPSAMREIFLETPEVRWSDVGGQVSTIQRLKESVEWPIKHADAFARLGINTPKGVLLYGPPGCSKTMLAKALATEAGLNFLAVKGPELFNKYLGESERAVREVFAKARAAAPSIIFFDEIDSLSLARGDEGSVHGDRILTALLNEMDGIEALKGVVVLGATNRPDVIDSALMRPGRLDRLIYVSPPDLTARKQILQIHFARMTVDDSVDVDSLAKATDGYSGAEIVAVCQEAGMLALNEDLNINAIRLDHFEKAMHGIKRQITPEMLQYFENFLSR